MATRKVGNEEGNSKGGKSNYNSDKVAGNKEGNSKGGKGNRDSNDYGR
jgi:hypothetical protein